MNHAEIEDRHVIARYERDALPQDERETFEEHLVDCPACQDAVDAEGELRRGLRAVLPPRATYWRFLNVAALVLLAISVAVLALQLRSAREEIHALAARRPPAPVVTPLPAALPSAAILMPLDRVRGGEASTNLLTLPATPHVVVLSVSRGDSTFAAYRLTLTHDGEQIAQTPELPPSDTFALAVPSASLPPGDYKLAVEGFDGGVWRAGAQYDLRARAGR